MNVKRSCSASVFMFQSIHSHEAGLGNCAYDQNRSIYISLFMQIDGFLQVKNLIS